MRYIAMLRAVNVGGKNKIKMADLREALEAHGFHETQTYIQSGNILFNSYDPESALRLQIESIIEQHFGFAVDVVLRTADQLDEIVEGCPYRQEPDIEPPIRNLYVALLRKPPPHAALKRLEATSSEHEHYQVIGRDIYLLLERGMHNSKLASQLPKLGTVATIRNWKTLTTLRTLAHQV